MHNERKNYNKCFTILFQNNTSIMQVYRYNGRFVLFFNDKNIMFFFQKGLYTMFDSVPTQYEEHMPEKVKIPHLRQILLNKPFESDEIYFFFCRFLFSSEFFRFFFKFYPPFLKNIWGGGVDLIPPPILTTLPAEGGWSIWPPSPPFFLA